MKTINLEEVRLSKGAHKSNGDYCIMELVSQIAEEPWSDHPSCASPVLGAFLRSWNDSLDDENRQRLKPYATRLIGTANDGKDDKRAWMCVDWLARTQLPVWLDLAGLSEHAAAVRALIALDSSAKAVSAQPVLAAAGDAARAALNPTVKNLQESAFQLLDRMLSL